MSEDEMERERPNVVTLSGESIQQLAEAIASALRGNVEIIEAPSEMSKGEFAYDGGPDADDGEMLPDGRIRFKGTLQNGNEVDVIFRNMGDSGGRAWSEWEINGQHRHTSTSTLEMMRSPDPHKYRYDQDNAQLREAHGIELL